MSQEIADNTKHSHEDESIPFDQQVKEKDNINED